MDTIQKYAEAKRSGLYYGNIPVSHTPNGKTQSNTLLIVNIIVLLLALAFCIYAFWLVHQKNPKEVVTNHLQDVKSWAIAAEQNNSLQQYTIDKFFAAKPKAGQRFIMLVCQKESCKTFQSPDTIIPSQY